MADLYAEDLAEGDTFDYGTYTVTEEEIIEFGRKYDPQPFHTDPAAAADSMFGELVASGWHVAALTNRLLMDAIWTQLALQGGRGVDDVRFRKPVRPGDELSGTVEVAALAEPDTDRGTVDVVFETTTRRNGEEPAFTATILSIVACRDD